MGPWKRPTKALFIWLFLIIYFHINQLHRWKQSCNFVRRLFFFVFWSFVCLFVCLNFPLNTVRRLHVIWKVPLCIDFILKHRFAPPTTQGTPFNTITQTPATDGVDVFSFVRGEAGRGGEGNCQELYEILTEEGKTKLSTRKSKILYDKEANDFFFLALQHFLIMTWHMGDIFLLGSRYKLVPQPASGFARLPAVPLMTILSPDGLQIKPRPFTRPSLVPASKRHFFESELLGLYWIFAGRRFEPKGTECVLKQCCFPHDLAALEEEEGTVTSPLYKMSCL